MASEKRPPPGPQNPRRRRPPVINLEATEVKSAAAAPHDDVAAPAGRRIMAWLPQELSAAHVSAGIAGAIGALFLVLMFWLVGAMPGGRDSSTGLNPRLVAIEKQLKDIVQDFGPSAARDLAARPAPAGADTKLLDDAVMRLANLETAQSKLESVLAKLETMQANLERAQAIPRAPVTDPVALGRLTTAENAVNSLADNVAAMARRTESIDATLRDTSSRIEKLAAALAELQVTARSAAVGSDRAVRLALVAAALRAMVERGDPYVNELAAVKPLISKPGILAPLEPFANSGMPSDAALAQELKVIVQPMLRAAGASPPDGNFLDRLQTNAGKIVRIRPVEDTRGDDRGAILARIEQRAAQANISGAMAELAKLTPTERAALQGWIAKVEGRNNAIEASRRFAADAMAALNTIP
jgi:hypothetical protein